MVELSARTLHRLPSHVRVPAYDRDGLRAGIVHIGVGNFHRVHQAVAVQRCLEQPGHEDWAICGIGILDGPEARAKAEAFRRQDGLHTVTAFAADGSKAVEVVGAMADYLHAPADPDAALRRLAAPGTRIASLTITEGGYGLDKALAESGGAGRPRTAFDYLVEALDRRRRAGLPPFTVMSCDNLRSNGDTSRAAVLALAERRDGELAAWIERHGAFPNSMVDRIAPRVTAADRQALNAFSGIEDALPASCESYTNWVMEDRFCNGRPPLERAGVSLRDDVAAFEAVKGRLSNAAHMLLAYPAVLLGYRLINEAMRDGRLVRLLQDFWTLDAIPLVTPPPGLSPQVFTAQVLERFANPGIDDQVLRVAHDGASKLVVFHARTLAQLIAGNGPLEREAFLFACFARYLLGVEDGGATFPVDEPRLDAADWARIRGGDPLAVLHLSPFTELRLPESERFRDAFARAAQALAAKGAGRALAELVGG
ncbi:mannitol dehydrogenase family protein [Labrys wisconsinensis]|uniref:Mannitol 2-dehydrogenase/sorbose reductase n=1 Tax=Labrys wisconsinensis TaxID=425677 RepID=A0ABU0JKA7_9HYPH|nr:mannitol dehydrogenase family protein [Labrys wisconsinensis]MDQ0474727.1 mannitol 2-dehydrogenase/sorbose reductase [Labrys wisconsinensis]